MSGKVALVTGGAEGIGATVGRMIVDEGGSVMLCDVQIDKARELAEELGDNAEAFELDVRNLDRWHEAVKATQERFGKLTVLCNIAGISEPGNVVDGTLDTWERTIDINLNGPYYGMRAALPAMESSGEPCAIVNIGSMIAIRAAAFVAAYSASKAGLLGLTRSVALDCAERGVPIRANMVHPGAIRTPMYNRYKYSGADEPENIERDFAATHPMNRIGEPEEVARAVVWLASDEASFSTGCDITVDGGGSIRS
ncbi:SDR family oxidoreductase [Altererythrobacter sp.]|uniref:SDR family NAD(P)-dependent oxidoreductase n=1 Tax=Altererythrobacter sp. TaxID=1872480 RepID=UPI001B116E57|nr:SDR family oxidoreductase [Altererythrobacter sp.]MBO6610022.1 SDR family oxidoreductase [Altererythrobacter sp.]MBO6642148.1 SDR family oxidoreductase [Altererythrobacter sp.]MBO6709344.1 SDR family oxidoreductase [Altererythrobacter sp.]